MNAKQPILSICIPTYNRAEYLKGALDNLTSDPSFDERVEVVVSDNASTDDTIMVVSIFTNQYSNIKYYRNENNVKDHNFSIALSRATGRYVKLFNDTLRLKENALALMLQEISVSDETVPLFFYNNIRELARVNHTFIGNGINSFIEHASYLTTWIANFGCWKVDIEKIILPNRFSELQLSQVDWTFQIISNKSHYSIVFSDFYSSISSLKKGGYNIFRVFVHNYLYILNQYSFRHRTIEIEKKRLLKFFVFPWMWRIYTDKDTFFFDTNSKWRILIRYFYKLPIFYWEVFKYFLKVVLNKLRVR